MEWDIHIQMMDIIALFTHDPTSRLGPTSRKHICISAHHNSYCKHMINIYFISIKMLAIGYQL